MASRTVTENIILMAERTVPVLAEYDDTVEAPILPASLLPSSPIDTSLEQPDDDAQWARAQQEATIVGGDPNTIKAQLDATGKHAQSMEVEQAVKASANEALYSLVNKLKERPKDKPVTRQEYELLKKLYKNSKGIPDNDAKVLGAALITMDKMFQTPAATNTTAGRVDAARKERAKEYVLENFGEMQNRINLEESGKVIGDTTKGETKLAFAVEGMSMFVPVFGTLDAATVLPALAQAYYEGTGKTLPKKTMLYMGDMLAALRNEADAIKRLPKDKQEAALRKLYGDIYKNTSEIGLTQGKFRNIVDIVPSLSEKPTTFFSIGDKAFTSDSLMTGSVLLEMVFGLVGLRGAFKVANKSAASNLARATAHAATPAEVGSLTAQLARLRPRPPVNGLGPAIRETPVHQIAGNPLHGAVIQGNSGRGIDDFLREVDDRVTNATLEMNARLFDDIEQDALIQNTRQSILDTGGTIRPEYSEVIARDNSGFRMSSMVANSNQSGWDNPLDAIDFAVAHTDQLPLDNTVLMRRDLVTGEFEEVSDAVLRDTKALLGTPGEYFLKVDTFYKFDPADRALFGAEAPVQVSIGGPMARMFLEPASRFSKQMMDFARGAVNKESAVKDAANTILKGNFLRLHGDSRAKVMNVLEEGDKLGKEFEYDELVTKYPDLSVKEIKAYYEARGFNRYLYETANRQARDTLVREGWQAMYKLSSQDAPEVIRKVRTADVPENVFDPRQGKLITREEALASGLDVLQLRTPKAMAAGGKYTHTLSTADDLYDQLPVQVLNFNPGQVTRVYDENWFIRATSSEMVNGKAVETNKVVAVARTWKEAEEHAAKLNASAPAGTSFKAGRDEKALRALSEGTYDFDVQGALLVSGRGSRLTRTDGSPARILDPINAMNVARDVVANRAAWTDYMASMKALGQKMWPDAFKVDEAGNISLHGTRTEGDFEEAEHFYDWIRSMEANDDGAIMFKQRMVQASRLIQESKWGKRTSWVSDPIARGLNRVPGFDPLKLARSTAFLHHVALSGPRTIVLNGLQPLFLAGIAPIKTLRGLAFDQWALHIAMLNRDNPKLDSILAGYLKVAGLGTGDMKFYKAAMEGYRKSGLPYSIDSHAFFRGSDFSPALKSTDGAIMEVVKGVVTAIPRAGAAAFRGGEQMNLASTFMVAARRYKAKHPNANWDDPRVWSDIGSDARALSLDMSKVNDFTYQKGWLAVPYQYIAVTHKALTFMTTNNSITKMEKARVFLAGAAIYGSQGIPFGPELVEDAMEKHGIDLSVLPAEDALNLRNMIHGGLIDMAYNNIFLEEDGTPGSVKVSKSLSMVNGVIEMYRSSLFEDETLLNVIAGAPGSVYGTYQRVAAETDLLFQRGDYTASEKVMAALSVAPEVTSGWSRYAKAQLGMQMMATVNKNFKPGVNQTVNENWAKGLFGFESYREAETYAMQATVEDIKKDTQKEVEALGRQLVRMFSQYGTDYDTAHKEILKYQSVYVQSDYTYWVWDQAVKSILIPVQDATIGGGMASDKHEKLIEQIIKGMTKGDISDSLVTKVTNSDEFLRLPPEQQEELRSVLKSTEDQFSKDTLGTTEEEETN